MKDKETIYKADFRFPTEQYGYIEIHSEGSAKELKSQFLELGRVLKVEQGLETKEWNQVVDKYRKGDGMDVDVFERMNEQERWFIHEIDKSDSRIKTK